MPAKQFRLRRDQIMPLVPGRGSCMVTDMIVIDGYKVGFMYCEKPDDDVDSGWRFLSGRESQEYMDDAKNIGIYDVNTIANYDPDIISTLDAPLGSAFERNRESGQFAEVDFTPDEN